jgi:hypothetical protein
LPFLQARRFTRVHPHFLFLSIPSVAGILKTSPQIRRNRTLHTTAETLCHSVALGIASNHWPINFETATKSSENHWLIVFCVNFMAPE